MCAAKLINALLHVRCSVPSLQDLVCLCQPVIFRYLMGYFASPRLVSPGVACLLALCLALTNTTLAFVGPQIVFRYVKFGMAWQSATCGVVYKKVSATHQALGTRTLLLREFLEHDVRRHKRFTFLWIRLRKASNWL